MEHQLWAVARLLRVSRENTQMPDGVLGSFKIDRAATRLTFHLSTSRFEAVGGGLLQHNMQTMFYHAVLRQQCQPAERKGLEGIAHKAMLAAARLS